MEVRRPRSDQELRLTPLRNERLLCRRQGREGKRGCGDRGGIGVRVKQTSPGLQHDERGRVTAERNVDGEQAQQGLGLIRDGDIAAKGSLAVSQRAVTLEEQKLPGGLEQRKINIYLASQGAR